MKDSKLAKILEEDKSFFLFSKNNPIRKKITAALDHKYVTIILFITIVIDVATQILDSPPMNKNEGFEKFQDAIDIIITVVFSVEMLLRMISMGVVFHKESYLRFHFYRLDFVINIFLYVGFSGKLPLDVSALRAIRPLRMLRFIRGVRLIFAALGKSIKSLSHVLLLVGFFFILFGIAGLQVFGGNLKYQCVDSDGNAFDPPQFCNPSKSIEENECVCMDTGNPDDGLTGFDNIGISFFTIYRCMTGEDWHYTMYWLMERTPQAWLFFIPLQFLLSFIILNLFTSVMTFAFMKAREEDEAAIFHSDSANSINEMDKNEGKEQNVEKENQKVEVKKKEEKSKHPIVLKLAWLTNHIYFLWFMNICIMANTIFMAMYHHDMSDTFVKMLGVTEIVFNVIFIVELVLKVIAFNGPIPFFKDKMNIFDFVVVVATIPELFIDDSVNISFLRTFRLLRVMRLVKNVPVFARMMSCAFRSMAPLAHLSILLAIVMIMYCVLGMQLYGGLFPLNARFTFDDFPHAFLTMFAILTGEWVAPFYDAMNTENGWTTPFFVISYYMFTNYVILNLLITIILENFELADNEKERKQIERYEQKVKQIQKSNSSRAFLTPSASTIILSTTSTPQTSPRISQDIGPEPMEVENLTKESGFFTVYGNKLRDTLSNPKSVFIFKPSNVFRKWCKRIVEHKAFEVIIIIAILVGAILLALEDPSRKHNATFKKVVSVTDIIFLVIFTIEAVGKIVAHGFVFVPNSYLRSPWNILDFVVLVISYVTAFATTSGGIFRVFRVARALRPLRMINKNPSLKFIISSIISSIPAVGSVCLLLALFILMFGILGVILFSGKFYYCNDSTITIRADCIGDYLVNNVSVARVWQNVPYNFDNIGYASLTMFQLTTLDAWPVILVAAADAVGEDKQPKFENQFYSFFFFVAFILLVSLFIINLLVGEIVYHFYESRGDALLTGEQKKWRDGIKRMMTRRVGMDVRPPRNRWARKIYDIVNPVGRNYFDMFIIGVIVVNILVMMTQYYDEPADWVRAQDILNNIFVAIFVIEAALKIIALRISYFKQPWNLYDFFVTLVSLIVICVPNSGDVSFMRAFRLFRLFRVIKAVKQLKLLFATLLIAVPSALNVGLLLLLLMFIFAILGVQLFGEVILGSELNEDANFQNFPNAMLTLFRVLTMSDWVQIQWDCMVQPPHCEPGVNCGYAWAPIYFVAYILLGSYMMLNLFIVIMVDSFQAMSTLDDSVLSEETMQMFKKQWRKFDKDSTGKIPLHSLRAFVTSIPPPLGIPAFPQGKQQYWFIYYELKRRWEIKSQSRALPSSQSDKPPKPFTKVPFALLLKVLLKCNAKKETLEYSKRIKWEERQQQVRTEFHSAIAISVIVGYIIRRRAKKLAGLSSPSVPVSSPIDISVTPPVILSPPSNEINNNNNNQNNNFFRNSNSPVSLTASALLLTPSPLLSRRLSSPNLSRSSSPLLSRRLSSPHLTPPASPSPYSSDDELGSSTSLLLPPKP